MTRIAEELDITKGTLSVSIKRLEEKGYLKRRINKYDRRFVELDLTEKGKEINDLRQKFRYEMIRNTIDGFEEEEAEVLIKGLAKLSDYLKELKETL